MLAQNDMDTHYCSLWALEVSASSGWLARWLTGSRSNSRQPCSMISLNNKRMSSAQFSCGIYLTTRWASCRALKRAKTHRRSISTSDSPFTQNDAGCTSTREDKVQDWCGLLSSAGDTAFHVSCPMRCLRVCVAEVRYHHTQHESAMVLWRYLSWWISVVETRR